MASRTQGSVFHYTMLRKTLEEARGEPEKAGISPKLLIIDRLLELLNESNDLIHVDDKGDNVEADGDKIW